ncbi:ankyrin repeat domain-containing protein [Endozoicomonas sp. SESOKO1]|uniref:ankyrin repeat domain-containing protein n=1 Tax=Endozoicomonas sp. SESOKO1 TaxID=2828742 RepID=UPI0021471FB1|nr:ankyrin repeat domain-containing protein [Endozoicomonas sp. SESOKO1]
MNSVTNSINTLSNSSTCALCNDPTTSLFGGRSVVTASCPESHQFHFDCIVQPLLDQAKAEAKRSELHCLVCSEQPVLPLLRGSQPLAEHACRYGDLEALGKMLDLDIDNIGWQQSGGAIYADNLESRIAVLGKIAAKHGQVECLQLLWEKSKGPNPEPDSVLYTAAENGRIDCLEWVLSTWFKEHHRDYVTEKLNKAMCSAAREGQVESMRYLMKKGGLVPGLDLNYALFNAVGSGSIQCMQPLVDAGADINGRFEKGSFLTNGFTPLTWSVSRQDKELMNAVMLAGANVDVKNQFGDCALHIAAGLNDITYLRKLLESAADRNARDQQGRTALHLGNRTDNVACAEILIRAGADINARDCSGETALFAAVKKNNIGYIMALIDANADINVKNNRNQTALEFASDVQCRRVLMGAGAMYSWQLELLYVAEAVEDLHDLLCTLF